MSVQEFSVALQSEAYKSWFAKLEKNIVSSTVDKLRSSQQKAAKTDFLITEKDITNIFKSLTGDSHISDVKAMLQKLADNSGIDGVKGSFEKVNGQQAILFKGIGFDTITEVLNRAFSSDEIDYYLQEQTELYKDRLKEELKNDPTLSKKQYNAEWQKIDSLPTFTIGSFFDKGHVVSVAANLTKAFRLEIQKSNQLADKVKLNLTKALDAYIKKLEQDDLATANMPKEVYQNIAGIDYTKSVDKYLVEMQYSVLNRASGRQSKAIVEELRRVFTPDSKEIAKVFNSSSTGTMLLESESSPTYLELLAKNLASIIKEGVPDKKSYSGKINKPITKKIPVNITTKNNKKLISSLNTIKRQISSKKPKTVAPTAQVSLTSLQALLDTNLVEVIKRNMGNGNRRDILNLRSGRFAESVKVERMSQSREGMITAFYTYMKNPYATFSQGGDQEFPRTRDPKLLISKSIREIATQQVANRLRAVAI